MAPKTKCTVALYAVGWSDHVNRMTDGVIRYAREHAGVELVDLRFADEPAEQPDKPPPWAGRPIDGVITSMGRTAWEPAWLMSAGTPLVNVSADLVDAGMPSVHTAFESIARLAADHLIQTGYRRFAHVGYKRGGTIRRTAALADELTRRGHKLLRVDLPGPRINEDPASLDADPAIVRALRAWPKPIGVLALNDVLARQVCLSCEKAGFDIPGDVGVLGVGDTRVARVGSPSLSSIRIPSEDLGYHATRMLHQLIRGGRLTRDTIDLDAVEVVTRQSTARATPDADEELERAIRLIQDNACLGLSVEEVMLTLTISRPTFEKRFTQRVGRTPGQELQRIRLERAKELLTTTGLSVTRVASMIGFARVSSFSAFVHRHTGKSPRALRQARKA